MNAPAVLLFLLTLLSRLPAAGMTPDANKAGENSLRWNAARGYRPFRQATPEGLAITNSTADTLTDIIDLPAAYSDISLSFRAANLHAHPGKGYRYTAHDGETRRTVNPLWGVRLISSAADTLTITVRSMEKTDPDNPGAALLVSTYSSRQTGSSISRQVEGGFDLHTGINLWHLTLSDSLLTIHGGNRKLTPVLTARLSDCRSFGFIAAPGADLRVTDIAFIPAQGPPFMSEWASSSRLDARLAQSKDSLEGRWRIFDRDLEETLLRPGGDYRLAIVKDGSRYLLIYLSGAQTNNKKWRQGMVKAILTPDIFPEIFDVVWYDAEGKPLSHSIKAQLGEGNTITIQFPYQGSSLRLRKASR